MELSKMSGGCVATPSEELRKRFMDICTPHNEEHWWAIGEIDRLTQRLALKDADLLLEWDRAEKAEKELETERMRLAGCGIAALGYFNGCVDEYKSASLSDVLALKARYDSAVAQVKMLVEALNAVVNTHSFVQLKIMAEEAIAKVKEEEHKCACCGTTCGDRYPTDDTKSEFLCCECAA